MKAIFLDVDGTLTAPGSNTPPDSALKAIHLAQKAGNKVLLCTGRNKRMFEMLLHYGFDGVVGSSGGYVTLDQNVIYDHPIPMDLLAHVQKVLEELGVYYTLECRDAAFTTDSFKDFLLASADGDENSEVIRLRRQIMSEFGFYDLSTWQKQPAYKLSVMAPRRSQLEEAGRILKKDFNIVIQQNYDGGPYFNGELLSRDFNKGTGILAVCSRLSIPVEDTVGFGDSMNDAEMIETVGLGICMENGNAALKEIADAVCPSVLDDGIYKAFEKYHLF